MSTLRLDLTEREAALIFAMRRCGHGRIDSLTISEGQPAVLTAGMQRIDLLKETELTTLLRRGAGVLVDHSKGGLATCIEDLIEVQPQV